MDIPQLATASGYVNNLLLARGLLRNGKPVDFALLSGSAKQEHASGACVLPNQAAVAAEAINLVHDLVLRRDRDSDQLTSLAESLSDLRGASHSQTTQLDRVRANAKELRRDLDISQSSLRSANNALRSSESSVKALKEELFKTKITLAQVKTQCANDIRKRDVQIQKLKTHLTASQRGSNGRTAPTCTVSQPQRQQKALGVGSTGSNAAFGSLRIQEQTPSLEDTQYSLKQETTDFLTKLSQNLSDENDSLIALIRNSVDTLRELQNLPPSNSRNLKSHDGSLGEGIDSDMLHVVQTSYSVLSTELELVLQNLRSILTDASFVSIEEVITRDDEINRLRDGWDKMERRWREVVDMMKSWQDRLLHGGATVNLEELRFGLGLGEEFQGMRLLDASSLFSSERVDELDDQQLPEEESSFEIHDEKLRQLYTHSNDQSICDDPTDSPHVMASPPLKPETALQERSLNTGKSLAKPLIAEQQPKPTEQENKVYSTSETEILKENKQPCQIIREERANNTDGQVAKVSDPKLHTAASVQKQDRNSTLINTGGGIGRTTQRNRLSFDKSSPNRARPTTTSSKDPPSLFPPTADDEVEIPMTVDEKLKFAESEARRVSGTSVSSLSPPQTNDTEHISGAELPSISPSEDVKGRGLASERVQESATHADRPESSVKAEAEQVGDNTKAEHTSRQNTATTAQKKKAGVPGRTPKVVSKGPPPVKTGRTVTTRVPTKPPAPTEPNKKRVKPKSNSPGPTAETKTDKRSGRDVDASLRRSRRKRKSTLSPEELEELMGLRQGDANLPA